jgi:ABC-type nitrate/sulfonate/bicarbonate transport system permease component
MPVLRRFIVALIAIAVVTLVWHGLVILTGVPNYIVPKPYAVLNAFVTQWRSLASHAGNTAAAAIIGLACSSLLASLIAVAFSLSRNLAQASLPVVLVFRSTPVAAVAPIMTLMLGRGIGISIAVVTVISFFPILVNLMRGLSNADRNANELLYVYGASKVQQMRFVRIPYALPYLFTGLRVSGTNAILGAMLSEWITGTRGLGKLILDAGDLREIELLWAAVLTSIILALSVFWATAAWEKKLLSWKP